MGIACALWEGRRPICWGSPDYLDATMGRPRPLLDDAPDLPMRHLVVEGYSACALGIDDERVRCWGEFVEETTPSWAVIHR